MNRVLVGGVTAVAILASGLSALAQTHLKFSGDDGPYNLVGKKRPKQVADPKKENRRYNRFYFVTCNPKFLLLHRDHTRVVVTSGYKWPNDTPPDCKNHNEAIDPEAKDDG